MHGITHVPGGSDPIPGLTLDTTAPPYASAIAALADSRDLRGYWRLGEGAAPYADTSPVVWATSPYTAAPAARTAGGTAMTQDYTPGALPAADDDGAVAFNTSTGAAGDVLNASGPGSTSFRFDLSSSTDSMTVAAFIKPFTTSSTFTGGIAGMWAEGVSTIGGWAMHFDYPSRCVTFSRRTQGGPTSIKLGGVGVSEVPFDEWSFVVGTYSGTDGLKLYINAALVASDPTVFATAFTAHLGVYIGSLPRGYSGSSPAQFYGGIDEVAVFGDELTAAEITTLYLSGSPAVTGGRGTTWHHGSGTPASGLGGDGDYYLDTANGNIWFRAAGTWSKIWDPP
jgi:hypothetical protein